VADARPGPEVDETDLTEQLGGLEVEQLLVSATSTFASLAYAKLGRGELPQARTAIDAVAALVPLVEGELADGLGPTLADLQITYAEAASRRQ
jgi:hypothetical protein